MPKRETYQRYKRIQDLSSKPWLSIKEAEEYLLLVAGKRKANLYTASTLRRDALWLIAQDVVVSTKP